MEWRIAGNHQDVNKAVTLSNFNQKSEHFAHTYSLLPACRAASTINVGYAGAPLTRRMSERELNLDSSYKKQRATSAHALHRKVDDSGMQLTTLDLRYYYTTQGTLSYRFFC